MNDDIVYDFDRVVDRHGTCATKFEEMDAKFGCHDLLHFGLPIWISKHVPAS